MNSREFLLTEVLKARSLDNFATGYQAFIYVPHDLRGYFNQILKAPHETIITPSNKKFCRLCYANLPQCPMLTCPLLNPRCPILDNYLLDRGTIRRHSTNAMVAVTNRTHGPCVALPSVVTPARHHDAVWVAWLKKQSQSWWSYLIRDSWSGLGAHSTSQGTHKELHRVEDLILGSTKTVL